MSYIFNKSFVCSFVSELENEIKSLSLPKGFFDSFEYTKTGNNLTHPVMMGVLARILSRKELFFAIDTHFNISKELKFQPDLVVLDHPKAETPLQPRLFIDYESPNSSDARILTKDVESFLKWQDKTQTEAPYIIITTLPKSPCKEDGNKDWKDWDVRYTSSGQYNAGMSANRNDIKAKPYDLWYAFYRKRLSGISLNNVYFVNIDGCNVALENMSLNPTGSPNWRMVLKQLYSRNRTYVSAWSNSSPSRRMPGQFGRETEQNGFNEIVVLFDVSGSLCPKDFEECTRELAHINDRQNYITKKITVILWDNGIQGTPISFSDLRLASIQKINSLKGIGEPVADLGKTLLQALPKYLKGRIDVVFCFTDGDIPNMNQEADMIYSKFNNQGKWIWVLLPGSNVVKCDSSAQAIVHL